MRLKPLVDWLPSRSRKLLPRLVTVAPADRLELITFGVGLGEGDGVGVGVGVGVAVGVAVGVGVGDCACAVDTTPMASTKASATSRKRPGPVFPARDGRDEQRMHPIPKRRSARSKNAQNLKTTQTDLPP